MKRIRNLLSLILIGSILLGCGKSAIEEGLGDAIEKKPFFVDVMPVSQFANITEISKNGRIISSEEIVVPSQVAGRVKQIWRRAGDAVNARQLVVQLEDSASNYGLLLERGNIQIQNALLQYQQTEVDLDKRIIDAQRFLAQTKENFSIAQQQTEQNIQKAQQDLENARLDLPGSRASLSLDVTKTNTTLQLSILSEGLQSHRDELKIFLDDFLYRMDTLYGTKRREIVIADDFDLYIGAKDIQRKYILKSRIPTLITLSEKVFAIDFNNISLLSDNVIAMQNVYNELEIIGKDLRILIEESIVPTAGIQQVVDIYDAEFAGYRRSIATLYSAFLRSKNQIELELKNTAGGNTLAQQQIALAETDIETQRRNAETVFNNTLLQQRDILTQSELSVANAQSNLDNLLSQKSNQLGLAQNQLQTARVGYNEIANTYKNLQVLSPIQGKVNEVFVDVGQEVNPGMQLFSIVNPQSQEVVFSVTKEEMQLLSLGTSLQVIVANQRIAANVVSISVSANASLQNEVRARLSQQTDALGNFVRVILPVNVGVILVPLQSVSIVGSSQGFVYLLDTDTSYKRQHVTLGKVWGDTIEITEGINASDVIVLTSMENFLDTEFILQYENPTYTIQTDDNLENLMPTEVTGQSTNNTNTITVVENNTGTIILNSGTLEESTPVIIDAVDIVLTGDFLPSVSGTNTGDDQDLIEILREIENLTAE